MNTRENLPTVTCHGWYITGTFNDMSLDDLLGQSGLNMESSTVFQPYKLQRIHNVSVLEMLQQTE